MKLKSLIARTIIVAGIISILSCVGTMQIPNPTQPKLSYESPEAYYKALYDSKTTTPEEFITAGDSLRAHKNYPLALEAYSEAINYKKNAQETVSLVKIRLRDVHYELGREYEQKELLNKARSEYEKILEQYSDFVPAREGRARILEQGGFFDKASSDYAFVAKQDSSAGNYKSTAVQGLQRISVITAQARKLFAEAQSYYNTKLYYEAADVFKQAFTIKPDYIEAKYYYNLSLGRHYLRVKIGEGQWEAIGKFNDAKAIKPNEPEVYFYLAQAYENKDQYDFKNTIDNYKKVIELAAKSQLAKESTQKIKELTARKEAYDKLFKKIKK